MCLVSSTWISIKVFMMIYLLFSANVQYSPKLPIRFHIAHKVTSRNNENRGSRIVAYMMSFYSQLQKPEFLRRCFLLICQFTYFAPLTVPSQIPNPGSQRPVKCSFIFMSLPVNVSNNPFLCPYTLFTLSLQFSLVALKEAELRSTLPVLNSDWSNSNS